MPPRERSIGERLVGAWVVEPSGCWRWVKTVIGSTGYGHLRVRRPSGKWGTGLAHRVVYEQLVGPIPVGLQLDHLCRNRACVNPAHLEPVTRKVNLLRGETVCAINLQKTHCKHGHLFDERNTYIRTTPWGVGRGCRTCFRLREAAKTAGRRIKDQMAGLLSVAEAAERLGLTEQQLYGRLRRGTTDLPFQRFGTRYAIDPNDLPAELAAA